MNSSNVQIVRNINRKKSNSSILMKTNAYRVYVCVRVKTVDFITSLIYDHLHVSRSIPSLTRYKPFLALKLFISLSVCVCAWAMFARHTDECIASTFFSLRFRYIFYCIRLIWFQALLQKQTLSTHFYLNSSGSISVSKPLSLIFLIINKYENN